MYSGDYGYNEGREQCINLCHVLSVFVTHTAATTEPILCCFFWQMGANLPLGGVSIDQCFCRLQALSSFIFLFFFLF